jgi:hypothetical protein
MTVLKFHSSLVVIKIVILPTFSGEVSTSYYLLINDLAEEA